MSKAATVHMARTRKDSGVQPQTAPTPAIEPRLLRLEDVAIILNVRLAQVYALVRSGDLPAVKLGGRGVWRVDRNKLEEFLEHAHSETAAWVREHPLTSSDDLVPEE
jgi:excisionase family DNA binding protein